MPDISQLPFEPDTLRGEDESSHPAQGMYQGVDPFSLGFLEDYEDLLQSAPHTAAERKAVGLYRAPSPLFGVGPSTTEVPDSASGRGAPARSGLTGLWLAICRKWQMSQAKRELHELDDHTLKDIGIHRCQIESVVRHGRLYGP